MPLSNSNENVDQLMLPHSTKREWKISKTSLGNCLQSFLKEFYVGTCHWPLHQHYHDNWNRGAKVASTLKVWVKHLYTKELKWTLWDFPGGSVVKNLPCQCRKFSSVQSLSHVRLFATPWTAACQASLSFTISWSLFKLMSIELVIPPNHLMLCSLPLPLSLVLPSIRS